MEYEIREADGTVIVVLSGNFYVESVAKLREDCLRHITEGKTFFVFDMYNLEYIDSSGLGVLITVQKRVRQRGGKVTLCGLRGIVRELFELTRLDKVFDMGKRAC
ncbi:MAG: hypothetical protein H6Q65_2040 [Firmicutes bacterium]|nr:hypothetical protein [Bacillota bacterium]